MSYHCYTILPFCGVFTLYYVDGKRRKPQLYTDPPIREVGGTLVSSCWPESNIFPLSLLHEADDRNGLIYNKSGCLMKVLSVCLGITAEIGSCSPAATPVKLVYTT